jgi:hypothetical protein
MVMAKVAALLAISFAAGPSPPELLWKIIYIE